MPLFQINYLYSIWYKHRTFRQRIHRSQVFVLILIPFIEVTSKQFKKSKSPLCTLKTKPHLKEIRNKKSKIILFPNLQVCWEILIYFLLRNYSVYRTLKNTQTYTSYIVYMYTVQQNSFYLAIFWGLMNGCQFFFSVSRELQIGILQR